MDLRMSNAQVDAVAHVLTVMYDKTARQTPEFEITENISCAKKIMVLNALDLCVDTGWVRQSSTTLRYKITVEGRAAFRSLLPSAHRTLTEQR